MIRDLLSAVQAKFAELVPPGTSAIASSPGAPGVAQVKVSFDGCNYFDNPVLVPAPVAPSVVGVLPLLLMDSSPGNLSLVPSGLVLNCSGNFTAGDTYSFTANAAVTFLYGKQEQPSQDSLF